MAANKNDVFALLAGVDPQKAQELEDLSKSGVDFSKTTPAIAQILFNIARNHPNPVEREDYAQKVGNYLGQPEAFMKAYSDTGVANLPGQASNVGSFLGGTGESLIQGTVGLPGGIVDLATAAVGHPTHYQEHLGEAVHEAFFGDKRVNSGWETLGKVTGTIATIAVPLKAGELVAEIPGIEELATSRPFLGESVGLLSKLKYNPARIAQVGAESFIFEAQSEKPSWKGVASWMMLDGLGRSRLAREWLDKVFPKQLATRGPLSDIWDVAHKGWKREADITGMEPKLVDAIKAVSQGAGIGEGEVAELLVGNPLQFIFRGARKAPEALSTGEKIAGIKIGETSPFKIIKSGAANYTTLFFDSGKKITLRDTKDAVDATRELLNGAKLESILASRKSIKQFTETYVAQHPSEVINLAKIRNWADVLSKQGVKSRLGEQAFETGQMLEESSKPYVVVLDKNSKKVQYYSINEKELYRRTSEGTRVSTGDKIRTGAAEIIGVGNLSEAQARDVSKKIWGNKRFLSEATGGQFVFASSKPIVRFRLNDGEGTIQVAEADLVETRPGIWSIPKNLIEPISDGSVEVFEIGLKNPADNISRANIQEQLKSIFAARAAIEKTEKAAVEAAGKNIVNDGSKPTLDETVAKKYEKIIRDSGADLSLEANSSFEEPLAIEIKPRPGRKSILDEYIDNFPEKLKGEDPEQFRTMVHDIVAKAIRGEKLTENESTVIPRLLTSGIRDRAGFDTPAGLLRQRMISNLFGNNLEVYNRLGPQRTLMFAHLLSVLPDKFVIAIGDIGFKAGGFNATALGSAGWDRIDSEIGDTLRATIKLYDGGDIQTFGHELSHLVWATLPTAEKDEFIRWTTNPAVQKLLHLNNIPVGSVQDPTEIFAQLFGQKFIHEGMKSVPSALEKSLPLLSGWVKDIKDFFTRFYTGFIRPLFYKRIRDLGPNPIDSIFERFMGDQLELSLPSSTKNLEKAFLYPEIPEDLAGQYRMHPSALAGFFKNTFKDVATIKALRTNESKIVQSIALVAKKSDKEVEEKLVDVLSQMFDIKKPTGLGAEAVIFGPNEEYKVILSKNGILSMQHLEGKVYKTFAEFSRKELNPEVLAHMAIMKKSYESIAYDGFMKKILSPDDAKKSIVDVLDNIVKKNVKKYAAEAMWRVTNALGVDAAQIFGSSATFADNKLTLYLAKGVYKKFESLGLDIDDVLHGINPRTSNGLFATPTAKKIVGVIAESEGRNPKGLDIVLHQSDSRKIKLLFKGDRKFLSFENELYAPRQIEQVFIKGKRKLSAIVARDYNQLQLIFARVGKLRNIGTIFVRDEGMEEGKALWYLRVKGAKEASTLDKVISTTGVLEKDGTLPLAVKEELGKGFKVKMVVAGGDAKELAPTVDQLKQTLSRYTTELERKLKELPGKVGNEVSDIYQAATRAGYEVTIKEGGEVTLNPISKGVEKAEFASIAEAQKFLDEMDFIDLLTEGAPVPSNLAEDMVSEVGGSAEMSKTPGAAGSFRSDNLPLFKVMLKQGGHILNKLPGSLDAMFAAFGAPAYHATQWVEEKTGGAIKLFTDYYTPISHGLHSIPHETKKLLDPIVDVVVGLKDEDENIVRGLVAYGYGYPKSEMTTTEKQALKAFLKANKPNVNQLKAAEVFSEWFDSNWKYLTSQGLDVPRVEMYHPFRWRRAIERDPSLVNEATTAFAETPIGHSPHVKPRTGKVLYTTTDKSISQLAGGYAYSIAREKLIYPHMKNLDKLIINIEHKSDKTLAELVALHIAKAYKRGVLSGSGIAGNLSSVAMAEAFFAGVSGHEFDKYISALMKFNYINFLGFRPLSAIKNLTQVPMVLYPIVGGRFLHEGMGLAREMSRDPNHYLWKMLDPIQADWLGKFDDATLKVLSETGSKGAIDKKLTDIYRYSMAMMRKAEEFNRTVSFASGYKYGEDILRRAAKGESIEAIINDTPLAFFNPTVRGDLLTLLQEGKAEAFKIRFGAEIVKTTQWVYGAGESFSMANSRWGRVLFQFGTWPSNYIAYLRRLAFASGLDPTLAGGLTPFGRKAIARWAFAQGTGTALFAASGTDPSGLFFLQPASYTGGPWMQLLLDFTESVGSKGDVSRATKNRFLKNFMRLFTPFSQETRDLGKTYQFIANDQYGRALQSLAVRVKWEEQLKTEKALKTKGGFRF